MKELTVSLLISTYNWPKALNLCLTSALNQTFLPDEIIIADDGSDIHTKELINKYKIISPIPIYHVWHSDNGFRLSEIRNKGILKATSDYIVQIDGDIILHKEFIKDYKKFAKKGQFIRGSRSRLGAKLTENLISLDSIKFSIFDKDIKSRMNGFRIPIITEILIKPQNKSNNVIGCNMGFWREDAIKINGYENSLIGWGHEDEEFATRLVNIGIKKVKVKYSLIVFHLYHKEKPRNNEEKHYELIQYIVKNKVIKAINGIDEIKNMVK